MIIPSYIIKFQIFDYYNSQNAGLGSSSFPYRLFFEKFILSRFHGRFWNRWHFQVEIAPATSNSNHGRALCYKTFLTENPGFLPAFRIFPDFYCTKLPRVISGFLKSKLYKNQLRIVGGDSKQRNLCSNTTQYTHTTSGIYVLMVPQNILSMDIQNFEADEFFILHIENMTKLLRSKNDESREIGQL